MVVQKRVRKEARLTDRRGTLQWGVELIMGRGTYHGARNPTMGYGTLQWGEDQNFARNPIIGCGTLARGGNPTIGRGTLSWGAERYHGVRNLMGRGTLP